jgi:butyrate response factor 1
MQSWYNKPVQPYFHTQKGENVDQNKVEDPSNPYAFKNNRRLLTRDYKIKLKTELCKSWVEEGKCRYGDKCAFAHGESEIKKKVHVPSMYKTKLCQQYHMTGECAYGTRCQFIHSENIGEFINRKCNQEPDLDLKKVVDYRKMLEENSKCLTERIESSHNPYLNEFNLVYKDFNSRMPVFSKVTNEFDLTQEEAQIQQREELLI